jgi:protein SCO1/2
MKRVIQIALGLTLGLLVVAGYLLVRGSGGPPPDLAGTPLQPPMAAPDFTLESADGPVSRADLEGKAVVLFFGYTYCPDVCPLTLARLAQALDLLEEEVAEEVQVVMISVDPGRDSPERVEAYAENFDPSFLGLTGEPEAVREVAGAYGIFHGRGDDVEGGGYLVDHSATVTVLDPDGRIRLLWPYDVPPEALASDLRWVVGS